VRGTEGNGIGRLHEDHPITLYLNETEMLLL
jgi:hypothetical protein